MKIVRTWLSENFGFSPHESRGFVILSIILLIALVAPFLSQFFTSSTISYQPDHHKIDSLLVIWERGKQPLPTKSTTPSLVTQKLAPFNPNSLTVEQWESLNIPDYLAKRIVKYVKKGGKFIIKSDLKKIYGFPEETYNKLVPYILLPQEKTAALEHPLSVTTEGISYNNVSNYQKKNKKQPITPFDINLADTTELKQIRGIGSKLAARIVKFRDKLGGFHSTNQLYEVYGLNEEVVIECLKNIFLEHPIKKIPINQVSESELKNHPYCNWKNAKVIVNYRNQHGAFSSSDDLKSIKIIDQNFINKIAPYLSFE